ncbi:MAG: CRISPR-associated helicase Cas3' [Candidatus Woesearchaeota archaeon]
MEIVDLLLAKPKNEKNYLLKDHLKETIIRALEIKDFCKNNNINLSDEFFNNLLYACFLHDLGKINYYFQKKILKKNEYDENKEELTFLKDFFKDIDNKKFKDHEIISLFYTLLFFENEEWAKKIRTAILLHHYNNYYMNKEQKFSSIFEDKISYREYLYFMINKEKEIKEIVYSLMDYIINSINIKEQKDYITELLNKLKNEITFNRIKELNISINEEEGIGKFKLLELDKLNEEQFYEFFIFLGFLRRCDYSASGNIEIEIEKEIKKVYEKLPIKIKENIKKENIWQEQILNYANKHNLILVAPTGSGKTEFALLWAKNRKKKLIYTLPLRVALNDIYRRFSQKESDKENYFDSEYVSILHSTSFIEYLKKELNENELTTEEKLNIAKNFSAPITIATPDQVLLISLKYYGFDKILSLVPLSCIVIDEIQAYNPEMSAVIIKTLEIIRKNKGNTLIMTATLPPFFLEYLKEYEIIDLKKLIEKNNIKKDEIKNYNLTRHKIELIEKPMIEEKKDNQTKEIVDKISNNKDKNIMIVVNNVKKSIEIYKEIKENKNLNNYEIFLLHSRIIEIEKSTRLNEIKNKIKEGKKIILVSTQLVEASVDVDFDILITEISPIESQIQRWGRIWRNRNENYSGKTANIYIFTGKKNGEYEVDNITKIIYDEDTIMKTIEILKNETNKVLNYENERELIERVYDKIKENYKKKIDDTLDWLKYYSTEKKSEAQRIFRNIAGVNFVFPDIMEKYEKGDNSDEAKIRKIFANILKSNKNISWEDIITEIKKEIMINNDERFKFELLKILYQFSINLPYYYLEKNRELYLQKNEFKGFYIMKLKDEKKIKEIIEMGFDIKEDIDKYLEEEDNFI